MFDLLVRNEADFGAVPVPLPGRVIIFAGPGGVPAVRDAGGVVSVFGVAGGGAAAIPGTLSDKFIERAYFLGGYVEEASSDSVGAAYTVTTTTGAIKRLILSVNCALTFPAASDGLQFTLLIEQGGTGAKLVTWPTSVRWAGGTAPTLTTNSGRMDVVGFLGVGSKWLGFPGGLNFSLA